MKSESIWMSITLFAPKQEWGMVLKHIQALMVKSEFELKTTPYILMFDHNNGEAIHFSVLRSDTENIGLLQFIQDYFESIFQELEKEEPVLWRQSIFQQFANFSIRYGIYPPLRIQQDDIGSFSGQILLSKITVEALADDLIDEETMLTFSFYLLFSACHSLLIRNPSSKEEILDILGIPQLQTSSEVNNTLEQKFARNKKILFEIANDIIIGGSILPQWMEGWTSFCREFSNGTASEKENLERLILLIRKQLALNGELSLVLSFFVNISIKHPCNNNTEITTA